MFGLLGCKVLNEAHKAEAIATHSRSKRLSRDVVLPCRRLQTPFERAVGNVAI